MLRLIESLTTCMSWGKLGPLGFVVCETKGDKSSYKRLDKQPTTPSLLTNLCFCDSLV